MNIENIKILHLSISLTLALFYCYVVFLIYNPNVSDIYRQYYIDNTIKYWPGETDKAFNYAIGDLIDLSKPSPYLSSEGWSRLKSWGGSRVTKGTAYLYLKVDSAPEHDVLMSLYPHNAQNVQKLRSRLYISVNHIPLTMVDFKAAENSSGVVQIKIPKMLFNHNDLTVIGLRADIPDRLERFLSGHKSKDYYVALKSIRTNYSAEPIK